MYHRAVLSEVGNELLQPLLLLLLLVQACFCPLKLLVAGSYVHLDVSYRPVMVNLPLHGALSLYT